ncbi:hypothetical protein AB1N83_009735 [Pleurotus pulmonarius]
MGRASKYHTLDEQRSARRATTKAYSQATSGSRSERRRASYLKSRSRKGAPYIRKDMLIRSLPPALHALALQPLPTSELFLEASRSADALDESEVAPFDGKPPYAAAPPSSDEVYTSKMLDVMSGRRARHEREASHEMERWSQQHVESELIRELADWNTTAELVQSYKASPWHVAMARNHLWWHARWVSCIFTSASRTRAEGST